MPGAWKSGVEFLRYSMRHQQISGSGRGGKLAAALVCLIGLGNVVMSQGLSTWDPVKTTCNLQLGRGVVVGDRMFFDGGEMMDQQEYKNGIDKPYRTSDMLRWQSECPSIKPT